ncbi:hypothetical protein FB451DRAFT_1565769 [Mycena latifolia]|nr:hypothetical protein FB451DRAFT_1565769 [Mycena latifolia]
MSPSPTDPGSQLSEAPAAPAPQHPRIKITPWRILNTTVLLILGTTKALSTFLGQTTAPNNLDWTTGVLWALISYWVSVVEQEAPELAPWFFTTDLSRFVRLGFFGFFVALVIVIFWSAIYGLMALTIGRRIHPPMLHGISVGIMGLVVLLLLVFATFRLARFVPRLRKFCSKLRVPRFYDGLFSWSDWIPDTPRLLVLNGLIWLSPFGITVMLTTRSWYDIETDSEVFNAFFLGAAMTSFIPMVFVETFFLDVATRMLGRWLTMLGALLRTIRLPRYLRVPTRWRFTGSTGQQSALSSANLSGAA